MANGCIILYKANVQRRWDNRGKTHKAFQRWRGKVWHEHDAQAGGKENGEKGKERERTYGIKYFRSKPKIHVQLPRMQTPEMGALGFLRLTSSQKELLPYHNIPNHTIL
eukprot:530072-Pleurochrysis_carterae.AAC.1